MTVETVYTNARLITADAVIEGSLVVRDGVIADIATGPSGAAGAIDLDGDYLMPGLVELHTDNLEKHFAPRPGVKWPGLSALMAHDTQIAAGGITTVLDSLALGDIRGGETDRTRNRDAMAQSIVHASANGLTRAEHFLHLRCEITAEDAVQAVDRWIDLPLVKLVSINDHTPGQRQFVDPSKLKEYYTKKYGMSDADYEAFRVRTIEQHHRFAMKHRTEVVGRAHDLKLPLASHDDATLLHVEEAVRDGMTVAEFPTTAAAARASHEAGMAVLVGAPNLMLGGSHSGNVAAHDLLKSGHVEILSSDYVPCSLVESLFRLPSAELSISLPQAVRLASLNPARVVGLDDRGEIAVGKRADLARVRRAGETAAVAGVWRGGERVI
jgi:alpha-D-ribose 1-methylphosphonate 5-triphosphate diphosphatase